MKHKITIIAFFILNTCFVFAQKKNKHLIENGIFKPHWQSFEDNYQTPDWFRDAKFGIWAHWSAQCVPEDGDWYARGMYIQNSEQYNYHVAHYGHPSEFGFMELDNLWKADKWEPEKLMQLYKKAGAKYFVALANHHDNFDAYNSKYHGWNSVKVGPHKDIVGTWEKIARANGLRFGVSNHSAHAWHWLQPAYGYDAEGQKAGVRYDAARLTKADGKGKWWEGLDPQKLYTGATSKMPDGIKTIKEASRWHENNDRPWVEYAPLNNPWFVENWYQRCKDLVDTYKPDLLYFDNFGLPLDEAGKDITAHFYNASMKWNNGKLDAVVNAKQLMDGQNRGVVEDYERSSRDRIEALPWQTCTCIGEWHYSKKVADENRYKTADQVVKMLIDIVSKNGNLLLSIPMRGDGTIDNHEVEFLNNMADWMNINGEAIFETRPWTIFGEGPTKINTGMFSEGRNRPFTAEDIRFTKKGNILYAFVMDIPAGKSIAINSLGINSKELKGGKITSVSMLGNHNQIAWNQTDEALHITLPDTLPCKYALALKITGIL